MYIPVSVHDVHVVEVLTHEIQNNEQLVQFKLLFDKNVPIGQGL